MHHVLFVEDNKETLNQLLTSAKHVNDTIHYHSSNSAKEALEIIEKYPIEAFFVDIQLEDYSGLEFAKQLRNIKQYAFVPIVFITGMPTRELEAFRQVHCYDYILKPFAKHEIESVFKKILIEFLNEDKIQTPETIALTFKSHTQLIRIDEIKYIEYLNRRIVITTVKESIQYLHTPLKKFKEKLPSNFLQIHQSIIVNTAYIIKFDATSKTLSLRDELKPLPVGRSYYKKVGEICHELF